MASIVAEAERAEGACPHIATPAAPVLVYGCSPAEAAQEAIQWADQAVDARGHKLRKDALCLLGGVVSMPSGTDPKTWARFKKDTVTWLKKEYGDTLKSVVEHTDEAHPHIHFYAVPKAGKRFDDLHDGLRAAREVNIVRGNRKATQEEKRSYKKSGDLAYANAMRSWQDRFQASVGRRYGLARIGPRKRRLTRAEWQATQAEARARAEAIRELDTHREALLKLHSETMERRFSVKEHEEKLKEREEVFQKNARRIGPALSSLSKEDQEAAFAAFFAAAERAKNRPQTRPTDLGRDKPQDRGR